MLALHPRPGHAVQSGACWPRAMTPSQKPPSCVRSKETNKKKKAYAATWDDYVNTSEEDETKERANLCFMALEG